MYAANAVSKQDFSVYTLFINSFRTPIDLSAPPELVGQYGAVRFRLIHHFLQKSSKAAEEKGGPRSALTNFQAPYMFNQMVSCLVTASAVVLVILE